MRRPLIARDIDLPAAPGDVWAAITSGTDAWQFPSGLELPAGDAAPAGGPIAEWDPPRRLVIRTESPDGTFNALEYVIEARGIEGPGTAGAPGAMDALRAERTPPATGPPARPAKPRFGRLERPNLSVGRSRS